MKRRPAAQSSTKTQPPPPATAPRFDAQPSGGIGALPLLTGAVYGPVRSRRLGQSLGINVLPSMRKMCTFNCAYCQYGWTYNARHSAASAIGWPTAKTIAEQVSSALRQLAARGQRPDRLTIAGHGEPTMHPDFAGVVTRLRQVRDELMPGVALAILSNATRLTDAKVCAALHELDERYMKLDAGDSATLRAVNGATCAVDDIVTGLQTAPPSTIQAMFVRDRNGRIDNSGDEAVARWIDVLRRIQPIGVHVYTIDRAPAWPYLCPVDSSRLEVIGRRVRQAGLSCEVFAPRSRPSTDL